MSVKAKTFHPSLFDVTARKHGGDECSEAAFLRLLPTLGHARAEVFLAIQQAGSLGATSKEVASNLGKPLNAVSGRFSELVRMGKIYRTSERRQASAVWRVQP